MSRERKDSIVFQVLNAFNEIKMTGSSKHIAKNEFRSTYNGSKAIDEFMHKFGKSSGIYSDKTFKDYLTKSINFAKYVKSEFGIKDISQINSEHVKAYFANDEKRGNQSAIEKFETALTAKYEKHFDLKVAEAVAKKERVFKERAGTHPYQDKNAILNYINESKNIKESHKLVVNIAAATGARMHKILTESGIKINDSGFYIKAKGGRIHELDLSDKLKIQLANYIEKTGTDFKLGDKEYKKILSELKSAALATGQHSEGLHGFKQNLAQEIRDDLQKQGKSFKEAIRDNKYIHALQHNREVSEYRRG